VSTTDCVIDILLILVIFRQVRPHELTPRAALLPLVLLVVAGIVYLRPFTVRGNDLTLIIILAAAGVVLGALSGLAARTACRLVPLTVKEMADVCREPLPARLVRPGGQGDHGIRLAGDRPGACRAQRALPA